MRPGDAGVTARPGPRTVTPRCVNTRVKGDWATFDSLAAMPTNSVPWNEKPAIMNTPATPRIPPAHTHEGTAGNQ